ncbi:MAG TPA: protein kinase [Bryobacteraceae bacterium]|nr:protein kinase [Bryobacteraceae bacterium]
MLQVERIEFLFHQALLLPPGVQRVPWLEAQCGGDQGLLREVISLLDAHAEMKRSASIPACREPEIPEAQFGAYRADQLIGHGGMSAVYRAHRADGQFEQTVALKVMAPYLAGSEFLRRFETERQLLATLNHNNITRLIDGGVSSAGDPYLITEYIKGQTIDRYCDERRMSVPLRLRIFLQVARAVDYAHRNLIVHRDLKPGNILVDEEGTVKLLDFGTASLLAAKGDITLTRLHMLTPRYASPEQLRGERVGIASDVFSLGVVLYELLTGAWPFGDPGSVLTELNRATSDVQAKPLAAVITDHAAEQRSVTKEQLRRALAGDLSAIVLKALDTDPARRYELASQFAADVEGFLDGHPVSARPQTALYRAGKFVRRRWLPVGAAAVFVGGLLAATTVAIYQARQARAQAARAQRMTDFTNSVFLAPSPSWYIAQGGRGKDTKLLDVLELASQRMSAELKNDPLAELSLRTTLARTFTSLGMFDRAQQEADRAATILPRVAGQAPRVEAELAAARCDIPFRQTKYREAEAYCREAVKQAKKLSETPNRLLAQAAGHLGYLISANRTESDSVYQEALAAIPHPSAAGDREGVLVVRGNRASSRLLRGEFADAAKEYQAVLAEWNAAEDKAGEGAMLRKNIGVCHLYMGDLAAAESELRKAQAIANSTPMGNEARALAIPLNLYMTLAREGKVQEAEQGLLQLKPTMDGLAPGPVYLQGYFDVVSGVCALKRGDNGSAEHRFRKALEVYQHALQPDHVYFAEAQRWLASALEAQRRMAEARLAANEAVRIWARTYQAGNPVLEEARAYLKRLDQ